MTITISPDIGQKARARAAATGLSVEAYIAELIREDDWMAEERPFDKDDPEFEETRAAIEEALEQVDRGEVRPAEEALAEIRAKYRIPR